MSLKVAIVGVGARERSKVRGGGFSVARIHAKAWANTQGAKLIAACDINQENLNYFVEDYQLEEGFLDFEKMLETKKPDIVDICTWPGLHREMVVKAAQSGVQGILCEKPMTLSLQDARNMIEVCRTNGVKLSVCHQRRFDPVFMQAKEWIDSGKIGQILTIHGWIASDLLSWGTHWMDMFNFLLDDKSAEQVFAQIDCSTGTIRYGHRVEDNALIRIQYPDQVDCYLTGRFDQPSPLDMVIYGDQGMIQIKQGAIAHIDGYSEPLVFEYEGTRADTAFQRTVENLVISIQQNQAPYLSAEKAIKATELIMAAYESGNLQKPVSLPLTKMSFPLLDRKEFEEGEGR